MRDGDAEGREIPRTNIQANILAQGAMLRRGITTDPEIECRDGWRRELTTKARRRKDGRSDAGIGPDIRYRGRREKVVRKAILSDTFVFFFRKMTRLIHDKPRSTTLIPLGGFVAGEDKRVERAVETRIFPLNSRQVVDFPGIELMRRANRGCEFHEYGGQGNTFPSGELMLKRVHVGI